MQRVVVGTAGHIDHGKTRLVAALTGIDCDRWAEEKERGITIDLGFAYLAAGDLQIGFVDVPGHERFIHNALAGFGGIRMMILVVAADEGVKPQTREHLAICSLLGIPGSIAVLSKADLVNDELLELAKLELEEELQDTPFADSPILTVSSETGSGISELKAKLVELASALPADGARSEGPARLPVDRAFHLRGLGALVTGTLVGGRVQSGDSLTLLPAGKTARVRSVQVHGQEREAARAGERTALQLTGVSLDDLARGMQLAAPGVFGSTTRLCARLTLLSEAPAPIRGYVPVRFHLYASELVGKLRPLDRTELEPGASGLVEIRLSGPVVAARGDRFIIRRPSPQTTLGGGEILDPLWHRRRGKSLQAALQALQGETEEALVYWVRSAGEAGISSEDLALHLGIPASSLEPMLRTLQEGQQLLEVPPGHGHGRRWLLPAAYERIASRAGRVLDDYFKRDRLARGMPKAEAVRRILPGRAGELTDVYLAWLGAQKVLVLDEDLVNLPGRSTELTGEESATAEAILREFEREGLQPSAPSVLCDRLATKPQIFEGVLRYLLGRRQLVRLPDGLVVSAKVLATLRRDLETTGWQTFSVGQFKDRFGLTRKWAIPLLEHLDSIGVTRRRGDQRQIVRK
jgi:selenocysteine-specific elongation factor